MMRMDDTPSLSAFAIALFTGFGSTCVASTVLFLFVEKPFSLRHPNARLKSNFIP